MDGFAFFPLPQFAHLPLDRDIAMGSGRRWLPRYNGELDKRRHTWHFAHDSPFPARLSLPSPSPHPHTYLPHPSLHTHTHLPTPSLVLWTAWFGHLSVCSLRFKYLPPYPFTHLPPTLPPHTFHHTPPAPPAYLLLPTTTCFSSFLSCHPMAGWGLFVTTSQPACLWWEAVDSGCCMHWMCCV